MTAVAEELAKVTQFEKKTVEEWLAGVNYKLLNSSYIPNTFALSFIEFIKLVNGEEGEENTSPVFHYKMMDEIGSRERRIANLCFRGSAKSTLTEYLILYIAVFGEIPGFGRVELGLYISDSIENGVKSMKENLEYRLENSEYLQAWIPEYSLTQVRWVFKNRENRKTIFKGYGAQSGIRGVKELGKRPVIAIMDDLISDEDARSKTVIERIKATVSKAIKYALHPTRQKVVWNGTPFNKEDPLYQAIESGGWKVNVYPVCEKFPCTREEFSPAWGDRFHYDYVQEQYNDAVDDGDVSGFYQELMLQIMGDEQRLINLKNIIKFPLEKVLSNKGSFNFYITTDFATSERTGADFSVIMVWAYTNNGEYLLVDGICKRQTMDINIIDLFRLVQKWKPDSVGVEVSGQQGGFVSWIYDQMMDKNIYFSLASSNNNSSPGIRPITNKLERFNVVVPWFAQQKFWVARELEGTELYVEMYEELSYLTPKGFLSKNDDVGDGISQLAEMSAWKPSLDLTHTASEAHNSIWGDDIVEDSGYDGYSSYIV